MFVHVNERQRSLPHNADNVMRGDETVGSVAALSRFQSRRLGGTATHQ